MIARFFKARRLRKLAMRRADKKHANSKPEVLERYRAVHAALARGR